MRANFAIAVLGGGLKKDANGWRTTNFNEGDDFGALGDKLRVVAGQILYENFQKRGGNVSIIVTGGRGQLRGIPDAPTVASILKKELMVLGVPEDDIIVEDNSGNAFEQLQELNKLAEVRGWQNANLISNEYHLPRVRAMIEHGPGLEKLKNLLTGGKIALISAEKVLLDHDSNKWQKLIDEAYQAKGMRERMVLENKGVDQIKSGSYRFFRIRKAAARDMEFLFNLRNEESVREVSLNSEPISLNTHRKWFEKKLAASDSLIFIAEIGSLPIAQVRFDADGQQAEVSIAVVKDFRGNGYGTEILKTAAARFFEEFPETKTVHAFINLGNDASLRSFGKAGYRHVGQSDHGGLTRHEMILTNECF